MQQRNKKQDTPETGPDKGVRMRRCLRCGERFPSEWAGERICRKCKSTVAWRRG